MGLQPEAIPGVLQGLFQCGGKGGSPALGSLDSRAGDVQGAILEPYVPIGLIVGTGALVREGGVLSPVPLSLTNPEAHREDEFPTSGRLLVIHARQEVGHHVHRVCDVLEDVILFQDPVDGRDGIGRAINLPPEG